MLFIKENAFENVVCEMAAILSQPQCVNWQAGTTPATHLEAMIENLC